MRLALATCFALLSCLQLAFPESGTEKTQPKPITKYLVVNGVLSEYVSQRDKINTCQSPRKGRCILLVSKTGEIISETASVVSLADHQMVLSYESTAGGTAPDLVIIGIDEKSPKSSLPVATNSTLQRQFTVEGNFCTSANPPACPALTTIKDTFVSDGGWDGNRPAILLSLSPTRALVSLAAEPDFLLLHDGKWP